MTTLNNVQRGAPIHFGQLEARLQDILIPTLTQIASGRLREIVQQGEVSIDFSPTEQEVAVSEWVRTYTFPFVEGLTDTTRSIVQKAIRSYVETPGQTRQELARKLLPAFGPKRAELIAVTEVTRASTAATNIYWFKLANAGIPMQRIWRTNNDARTCPICGPLNGKDSTVWSDRFSIGPPAHPRCRCTLTLRSMPSTPAVPRPIAPAAPPPVVTADPFPATLDGLVEEKRLGGSTGAMLVRDPVSGKRFVMKKGASADHLREEALADNLYGAIGANVPRHKLYDTPGGPVKLAEFIEGRSLKDALAGASQAERDRLLADIQKHFAADALLGNWDVVGQNLDNILIDKDGKPWRIDNGGSLRFRAQGARKAEFSLYPDELWTLRDAAKNRQTSSVFGSLGWDNITSQVDDVAKRRKALLDAIPANESALRATLGARLDQMQYLADTSRTMRADHWKEAYVDGFSKHIIGLRKSGIVRRFPARLAPQGGSKVILYDENQRKWDHLRGRNSIVGDLEQYVNGNGGDYRILKRYMDDQSRDSWEMAPQAFKHYLATVARDVPQDAYWWKSGADDPRHLYERMVKASSGERVANSIQSYHAFTYELLNATDLPNRDSKRRTVRVFRTEKDVVMQMNGLKPGDKGVTMRRGPLESTSGFQKVEVFGTELTVQDVPYHRVFGTYIPERYADQNENNPDLGGGSFLGDKENEFVALLDGIPFDYER